MSSSFSRNTESLPMGKCTSALPGVKSDLAYTSLDECKFITWLGRGLHSQASKAPRIDQLRSYRAGLLLRTDWRGMDRLVVLRHIDNEIAKEEAAPK
jgi:hypothetical protein